MNPARLKYLIGGLAAACLAALFFMGRVPQDLSYHQFADSGVKADIPNFHNVITNLPFLFLGLFGLWNMLGGKMRLSSFDRMVVWTLFLGIGLTGFGSAYYHIHPDNGSLEWDRLPMTLVFTSFFTLMLEDHVDQATGRWYFYLFIPAGILSILFWHQSELQGTGDLRPYIFIQYFPMLCLPLILIISQNKKGIKEILLTALCYGMAKVTEYFDQGIFNFTGYGGHGIKHLLSALAVCFIYLYLVRREGFEEESDEVELI